jgi:uncharacterized membrane protein
VAAQIPEVVDQNIATIHELRMKSDRGRRADQVFVDGVTAFFGSTLALYLHLAVYGAALVIASGLFLAGRTDSPINHSFISECASLEAIFLALFVLINQRRTDALERKHQDLHFQVSLLSENEITKLARLLDGIATKVGVEKSQRTEVDEIKGDHDPKSILDRLSAYESARPTPLTDDSALKPG